MIKKVIILFSFVLLALYGVAAQELEAFEDTFIEDEDESSDEQDESDDEFWEDEEDEEDSELAAVLAEFFARLLWYIIISGGSYSNDRMNPPPEDESIRPRERGEPLIPVLRSDTALGVVSSELFSIDQRMEAGYGALGLSGRYTLFLETDEPQTLHLWETYIHYRMSIFDGLEFSPGLGMFGMTGKSQYDGFSMTFPVRLHLRGQFSLEFLSAFNFYPSGVVGEDLDFSMLFDLGSVYPKLGYRRYGSDTSSLNIFYVGVSFIL